MKRADLAIAAVLVPLDYLALVAAAVAAYSLRFTGFFTWLKPVQFALTLPEYLTVVVPIAFLYLGIFALGGLYRIRPRGGMLHESLRVSMAASTAMAAVLAIAFFSRELFDSRFIILAAWALSIIFVVIMRLVVRLVQKSLRTLGVNVTTLVVIGKTKSANTLVSSLKYHPSWGYRVITQIPIFTDDVAKKLQALRREGRLDGVLLANSEASRQEILSLKSFADNEHLVFLYSADLFAGSTLQPIVHTLGDSPVIEVPKTPLDGWGAIYKRLFDVILSTLLILLTLPLQILVALALFLEQPGAIFFRKLPNGEHVVRVGQFGKSFPYFKFRSMIKNAHTYRFDQKFLKAHGNMREGTPLFKLAHDPRVTRVGSFIRKYSLDELPEFYLVFLGRMSLVGPRPHLPEEVSLYKAHERRVLTVKPGITGLSQVSGRANLDFEEEVRLDMHYIENWSPWMDLTILLKTPFAVLFRKGAY